MQTGGGLAPLVFRNASQRLRAVVLRLQQNRSARSTPAIEASLSLRLLFKTPGVLDLSHIERSCGRNDATSGTFARHHTQRDDAVRSFSPLLLISFFFFLFTIASIFLITHDTPATMVENAQNVSK